MMSDYRRQQMLPHHRQQRQQRHFPLGGNQSEEPDVQQAAQTAIQTLQDERRYVYEQAGAIAGEFEQARAGIRSAEQASRAQAGRLMNRIKEGYGELRIDREALLREYTDTFDEAMGAMSVAAQRSAEYQQMQLDTLAATGRLGGNAFATQRQMSRAAGDIIGAVLGQIGELQAHQADRVAELTLEAQDYERRLFSDSMGLLAGLVGQQMQVSLQTAGVVAQTYGQQAQALVSLAGIGADLARAESGVPLDAVRLELEGFWRDQQLQEEARRAREGMAHQRQMQELGFQQEMEMAEFQQQLQIQTEDYLGEQALENLREITDMDARIRRDMLEDRREKDEE